MRVLAISGSLRRGSHNTCLLGAAAEVAPDGVEVAFWDGLRELPAYDEDLDHDRPPAAVAQLRAAVGQADALLFATPEYNASLPGALKNAVDWLSRPYPDNALRGRPVAVVGASTGQFGGVWAQAELRKVLGAAGARTLEAGLAVPRAQTAFDEHGRLHVERLRRGLAGVLDALALEAAPRLAAA